MTQTAFKEKHQKKTSSNLSNMRHDYSWKHAHFVFELFNFLRYEPVSLWSQMSLTFVMQINNKESFGEHDVKSLFFRR